MSSISVFLRIVCSNASVLASMSFSLDDESRRETAGMLISNRYTRILEITATLILPTKGLFLIGTICSRAEPQYE
jgi:hypothetical protein